MHWQAPVWCILSKRKNKNPAARIHARLVNTSLRMPSTPPHSSNPANLQKSRTGLNRVWHAAGYSIEGLKAGWQETAFRQEALAAIVLLPVACWLGKSWVEVALLAGSVIIVMIVELLNTGIETAIDRIGPEWHDLSKRAKDMNSAAVLLSLLLCAATWLLALIQKITA